jgi:hypothetical protein
LSSQHCWFSGRMLACHAGGPGSIPGQCRPFLGFQPFFSPGHTMDREGIQGGGQNKTFKACPEKVPGSMV